MRNKRDSGKRTCVIVCFSGHGLMTQMTEIWLNEITSSAKSIFPIEAELKAIAQINGAFV